MVRESQLMCLFITFVLVSVNKLELLRFTQVLWLSYWMETCHFSVQPKFVYCIAEDDQEGVMDNLLEALKTGSAFNVNRDRKEGRRRAPRAAGGLLILLFSDILQ